MDIKEDADYDNVLSYDKLKTYLFLLSIIKNNT